MKNKLELIVIFLISLVFSSINFLNACQYLSDLSFDSQIIIAWQYTSSIGVLPYKDIYFPYGILFYFKNLNLFFALIYILLTPILLTTIFITIRNIWKSKIFEYLFFATFLIFISFYTNIFVFNRYGIIVGMALLLAYVFFKRVYIEKKYAFLIGGFTGIIFSLVNDQGIYSFLLFIICLIFNPFLREGFKVLRSGKYFKNVFISFLSFILGFCVGFLPFFVYLMQQGMVSQFKSFIFQISDFASYGKTPFIPYSMTIDNIFIYVSIFITIFMLIYQLSSVKKNPKLEVYIALLLLIVILLLEQKSLIRSLATQLTFVALLLYIVVLHQFGTFLLKYKVRYLTRIIVFIVAMVVIFILGLSRNNSFQSNFNTAFKGDLMNDLIQTNKYCLEKNLNTVNKRNSPYRYIVDTIKNDSKDPKIFNYLHDPIFYPLFRQSPPYYFTTFEATPLYAQRDNIKYIQEHDVEYVIYNLNMTPVADGVPAYARGNVLFKYILNNFTYFDKKDSFIILKKTKNKDLFYEQSLNKSQEFKKFLLDINLAAIPRSEGNYKNSSLYTNGNEILFKTEKQHEINSYLHEYTTVSSNTVLRLTPKVYRDNKMEMSVIIKDEKLQTSVVFFRCKINVPCIINISNVPLFYKKRRITEIIVDKAFMGEIELINSKNNNLW